MRRRRAVGFYTKGRGRGRKVIPITARSGGARRRVTRRKNWGRAPIAAPSLHEEAMKKIIEYDSSEPFTRDAPFTKEQVEDFNRYTHFPSDINKEFREDVTAVEKEAVDTLKKHGITTIPPDVKTSLWYYRKAVYNYYLESSRARSIAPPVSVVGASKYPHHRIPRSEKIRERALDQVETSKTYLRRALGRHTKGKLETSKIEKWLPLAQEAGSRVKFGKLYAEQIRKAAQEKTDKSGWDQQLASGNWDHVNRQRGRELYDKIIGSSTASNPSGIPKKLKEAHEARWKPKIEPVGDRESRDIFYKGQYIMSTSNPELHKFIKESKRELERTVEHKRGIIKGYQLVNLDSLQKEGQITESERKAGSRAIEKIYDAISPIHSRPKPEKRFFRRADGTWGTSVWEKGKLIDTRDATREEIKSLESPPKHNPFEYRGRTLDPKFAKKIRLATAGDYSEEHHETLTKFVKENVNENWPYSFYAAARSELDKRGIPKDVAHKEAIKIEFEALQKTSPTITPEPPEFSELHSFARESARERAKVLLKPAELKSPTPKRIEKLIRERAYDINNIKRG
ncbi:hypothetical protein ES703_44688 [subsurface metagenome]